MLTVTTWNVNGIRAREREVLQLIEQKRPDVLCLQEVKASPEQIPSSLCEIGGYDCYWHGQKGYSGVALHLSRSTFPRSAYSHPEFDHESRIVTAGVGHVVFASIYVPNGGKDFPAKVRFLDALDSWAASAEREGTAVMLMGDLNVAREQRDVHPKLRKPEQIGQTPAERAQLERLIGRGLVDLSRQFFPDDDQLFTWWAPWRSNRQRNIGWRLDYVLAHASLAEHAVSCTVEREFGTSDHAPVTAVFDVAPPAASDDNQREPSKPPVGPRQQSLFVTKDGVRNQPKPRTYITSSACAGALGRSRAPRTGRESTPRPDRKYRSVLATRVEKGAPHWQSRFEHTRIPSACAPPFSSNRDGLHDSSIQCGFDNVSRRDRCPSGVRQ
jgi:exodeoxyribonuclease-3